ncbi:MAG TPA: hypothetical protein VEY92_12400 [Pseudoxanthomonas sp.]|nr:hypothetical protein [Pseudoxanthomonas sp.]
MDSVDLLLLSAGVHSLGFAAFHLAFWKIFGWKRDLARLSVPNRAILQILNLRLIWLFLAVGVACLAMPDDLRGTPLGHGVLGFMALFWLGRMVEQFVFLRVHHWAVHTLTALFLSGAALFTWALLVSVRS